jgi:imidazolonepropionase
VDWLLTDLLPKIHRRRFVQFADLAWEEDPSRQEYFGRYLDTARKLRIPCKVHADSGNASEAIAMAIRQMAVAIDHLEHATAADAAILSNTGTIASLLPCTAVSNGGRSAPARALIEAGVALALGTDFNPQRTRNLSMQTVVALAYERLGMTPEEAITAATINGAFALGCADRVGSLEVGKSADLLLLNCSDYRDLTHNFGMNQVHMTMKSGQFIYKEGKVEPQAAQDFSRVPAWD